MMREQSPTLEGADRFYSRKVESSEAPRGRGPAGAIRNISRIAQAPGPHQRGFPVRACAKSARIRRSGDRECASPAAAQSRPVRSRWAGPVIPGRGVRDCPGASSIPACPLPRGALGSCRLACAGPVQPARPRGHDRTPGRRAGPAGTGPARNSCAHAQALLTPAPTHVDRPASRGTLSPPPPGRRYVKERDPWGSSPMPSRG